MAYTRRPQSQKQQERNAPMRIALKSVHIDYLTDKPETVAITAVDGLGNIQFTTPLSHEILMQIESYYENIAYNWAHKIKSENKGE